MFMMAAGMAMSVVSSMMQKGQQKAQSILAQAQADAANINREGQNALAASQASLANFQRTLANSDKGAAVDKEMAALTSAVGAEVDKLGKMSIQAAQESGAKIGALTAASGAQGVNGSSYAQVQRNARLQEAFAQEEIDSQRERVGAEMRSGLDKQGAQRSGNMDLNATFAAIDRTKNYGPIQESGKSQILGAALSGAASGAMSEFKSAGSMGKFLQAQGTELKQVASWFK